MTLAELIVDIIKDVVKDGNKSLTATNLIDGDFDNDPQYLDLIFAAVPAINRAISRLVIHKKIPFKSFEIDYQPDVDGVAQLKYLLNTKAAYNTVKDEIYNILNVVYIYDNENMAVVPYQTIDKTTYILPRVKQGKFLFQYAPKLPRFVYVPGVQTSALTVDLSTYGIDDFMCEFIGVFTRADLWEVEQPQLAQTYRELAEKYFDDIESQTIRFRQERVDSVYKV